MKKCKVEGCETKSRTYGLCKMHATRYERHGDPLVSKRLRKRTPEELKKHILNSIKQVQRVDGMTPCWEWQRCRGRGYGTMTINKTTMPVHRLSYKLFKGEFNPKLFICHKCDNPPCCNPAHLFAGTELANQQDKKAKGRDRYLFGEEHPMTKITNDDVFRIIELRKEGYLHKPLAAMYGVSQTTISNILNGKTWHKLLHTS